MPIIEQITLREKQPSPLTSTQTDNNFTVLANALDQVTKELEQLKNTQSSLQNVVANSSNSSDMPSSATDTESIKNLVTKIAGALKRYDQYNLPTDLETDCLATLTKDDKSELIRFDSSKKAWFYMDGSAVNGL